MPGRIYEPPLAGLLTPNSYGSQSLSEVVSDIKLRRYCEMTFLVYVAPFAVFLV